MVRWGQIRVSKGASSEYQTDLFPKPACAVYAPLRETRLGFEQVELMEEDLPPPSKPFFFRVPTERKHDSSRIFWRQIRLLSVIAEGALKEHRCLLPSGCLTEGKQPASWPAPRPASLPARTPHARKPGHTTARAPTKFGMTHVSCLLRVLSCDDEKAGRGLSPPGLSVTAL